MNVDSGGSPILVNLAIQVVFINISCLIDVCAKKYASNIVSLLDNTCNARTRLLVCPKKQKQQVVIGKE